MMNNVRSAIRLTQPITLTGRRNMLGITWHWIMLQLNDKNQFLFAYLWLVESITTYHFGFVFWTLGALQYCNVNRQICANPLYVLKMEKIHANYTILQCESIVILNRIFCPSHTRCRYIGCFNRKYYYSNLL